MQSFPLIRSFAGSSARQSPAHIHRFRLFRVAPIDCQDRCDDCPAIYARGLTEPVKLKGNSTHGAIGAKRQFSADRLRFWPLPDNGPDLDIM
jgi:hypothetical protein